MAPTLTLTLTPLSLRRLPPDGQRVVPRHFFAQRVRLAAPVRHPPHHPAAGLLEVHVSPSAEHHQRPGGGQRHGGGHRAHQRGGAGGSHPVPRVPQIEIAASYVQPEGDG